MTVQPGSRLGPYEILAPIGAGGMGEVFKARDTRLDRSVAIKVLPPEFAGNAQLRLRFEREAKTISQLNHPHICTLYDVGPDYLVMELLEGESLDQRLRRGPMPLVDVLKYGVQIAEALGRAHREGIVHRDLKPANIMIAKSGAKLLDFGLAKSRVRPSAEPAAATVQKALTEEGIVLGTFQYMAPEQLAGDEPDTRADIFALGAVLYEMATGRRAFEGKSKTSLIAAIISAEPAPIRELQPLTPPALEHVVTKCLRKDADDRWQNATDIAEELRWIGDAGSQAGVPAPVARLQRSRLRNWSIAAATGWLLFAIATAAAVVYMRQASAARHMIHTEIAGSYGLVEAVAAPLALSPNGQELAFITRDSSQHLWLRNMRTGEVRAIPAADGAIYPFWSPDGGSIGFFSHGKLNTLNIETEAVQVVCDAPDGRGGSWSVKGVIVFAPKVDSPLFQVPASGGSPVAVTKLPRSNWTHRNPYFLPDGEHFLFTSMSVLGVTAGGSTTSIASLHDGHDRAVLDYGSTVAYSDGYLFSVRNGTLLAQPFDASAGKVEGAPRAIANDVAWYAPRANATIAAAGNVLLYGRASRPKSRLVIIDGNGKVAPIGDAAAFGALHVSPDGHEATVERFDENPGEFNLLLVDLPNGSSSRLMSFGVVGENAAIFSPDAKRLLVSSGVGSIHSLWIQPVDSPSRDELWKGNDYVHPTDWSRDGKIVFYDQQTKPTGWDIFYIRLDGHRQPVAFLQTSAQETGARLSPDGHWVAFQSSEGGKVDVYVTSFPGAERKWRLSSDGGTSPRWSPDGKTLYYLSQGSIEAVDVREQPSFASGQPRNVEATGNLVTSFDVARDGRIVALRAVDQIPEPLTVVLNWRELVSGQSP